MVLQNSALNHGSAYWYIGSICFPMHSYKQYRTHQIKKQEIWSRLDFLFENVRVLHQLQYNDSRISYFPANLSPPFLLLVVIVGVLPCSRLRSCWSIEEA